MPIRPIERQNISEIVYDQIRDLIISGEWKQGDKIPSELELTKMFGVSRVSIRAALQKLEGQGILERHPGRGTIIHVQSTAQIMRQMVPRLICDAPSLINLNEFREIIECGAIKLAAQNCTPEILEEMEDNYAALCTKAEAGEDTSVLDVAFHCLIAKASMNPLLIQTFDIIYDVFIKNMHQIKAITGDALSIAYHRQLIDAIREKDCVRSEQVMHRHLSENAKSILDVQHAQADEA